MAAPAGVPGFDIPLMMAELTPHGRQIVQHAMRVAFSGPGSLEYRLLATMQHNRVSVIVIHLLTGEAAGPAQTAVEWRLAEPVTVQAMLDAHPDANPVVYVPVSVQWYDADGEIERQQVFVTPMHRMFRVADVAAMVQREQQILQSPLHQPLALAAFLAVQIAIESEQQQQQQQQPPPL
jgi:hypothetical protein